MEEYQALFKEASLEEVYFEWGSQGWVPAEPQ